MLSLLGVTVFETYPNQRMLTRFVTNYDMTDFINLIGLRVRQ